ncbi:MAG: hypothetical protein AAF543_23525, partial [Pseudomonadota bacterium]
PQLYMPRTNDRIYVNKFYGPFKGWEQRYDIILAYCFRFAASEPKDSTHCPLDGEAASYVAQRGSKCSRNVCYRQRDEGPDRVLYLKSTGLGVD